MPFCSHALPAYLAGVLGLGAVVTGAAAAPAEVGMVLENEYARYVVGSDGASQHFIDRKTGIDYIRDAQAPCARVRKGGQEFPATAATFLNGRLTIHFAGAEATAVLRARAEKRYFTLEVESVAGEGVEELVFGNVPLTLKGAPEEPFAACALALNLRTRVTEIPRPVGHLWAACYPRTGFAGAKVALVACPPAVMRTVLQEAVLASPDLPHSPVGGPWGWDSRNNRGSYLFNFSGLSEEKVDEWIRVAKQLGITQIDFHGGTSFRFGDCLPNPETYPHGFKSLKAVIDKLHAAGILAGLHTYACFIDKRTPWVTPVPHPELGKDATFTLAEALDTEAQTVPVVESTEKMSAITGFFVRNSVTLQIDDELIIYSGVQKEAPYAFTGCTRGAYGTKVAPHAKGAKVHHLRECFGLFVPDGDSKLFEEVAAKTAEAANECGFDMIYLDALDGGDAIAGPEWSWHYESKFVFEIWKRLKKPTIMEASTFHHHLWFVRSRLNAWDHPVRSHKRFIDQHCLSNDQCRRMFLPGHLGWWAFKTWSGPDGEPTYADDIEYLCAKALATDTGFSIMGIDPDTVDQIPALPRLAAIVRQYETLRHANYFNDAVKAKLAVLGDEYTLFQGEDGEWQFRPIVYDRHKVLGMDGWSNAWKSVNRFERQPVQLRIEALMSAGPYDAPGNITLADWSRPDEFGAPGAQQGVTHSLSPSAELLKVGPASGCLTAQSTRDTPRDSWARVSRTFTPTLDLSKHPALGVWVYGDGKGEVLNLQLASPHHLTHGIADHYIDVNFTGWRYFELVEPEGGRWAEYGWPYGNVYANYRELVSRGNIQTLSLYLNNLPKDEPVRTYLSPIQALPLVKGKLRNPAVTINGQTITFPVEIESGQVLEFRSPTDCNLYGPQGELIAEVKPQGAAPVANPGENEVSLTCEGPEGANPRAYVTVITRGKPLRGTNPPEQVRWELLDREEVPPRTVRAIDGVQNRWSVLCRPYPKGATLEAEIRVDSLGASGSLYNAPGAIVLESFEDLRGFADTPRNRYLQYVESGPLKGVPTAPGVTHRLELDREVVKVGKASARYTATSERDGGWSARGKRFSPPLDLSACTHIGFLLHGDGLGETLYVQLRDTTGAWHDLRTGIGFTGWKYVEFPLAGAELDLSKIEYLILYYNNLPAGKTVSCRIDEIRALRDPQVLRHPSLSLRGTRILFPVTLAPGERLVYRGPDDCAVYGPDGVRQRSVKPRGTMPTLKPGRNAIAFGVAPGSARTFSVQVRTDKVYGRRPKPAAPPRAAPAPRSGAARPAPGAVPAAVPLSLGQGTGGDGEWSASGAGHSPTTVWVEETAGPEGTPAAVLAFAFSPEKYNYNWAQVAVGKRPTASVRAVQVTYRTAMPANFPPLNVMVVEEGGASYWVPEGLPPSPDRFRTHTLPLSRFTLPGWSSDPNERLDADRLAQVAIGLATGASGKGRLYLADVKLLW